MDPTTHSSAPVQYSAAAPAPLHYTSAGVAPVAPPPPTDGCCGPHHTLLRSRTVLCCGPCSLTVHFRGRRPCSSAPPRRTGVVDPTTHSSAPVQYSAAALALLQYTSAGVAPVAQPPPTDGCHGPLHTLLRSRTVLCCGPCSLTVLYSTAAPGSGHLGGFHRPRCVAAAANASPCHGQSRDLCRPCCTAAPGSGHLAFSRPPAPPVALGVTYGRTTPRSYAKLTKTLIFIRSRQVHLRPRRLYLRSRQVHLRSRRLYLRPRPLYLHRSPLCRQVISTAARLSGNPTSVVL